MANRWYRISHNLKKHKIRIVSILNGVALFSALYVLSKIIDASLCPFYNIFGKKCFGCGMTRAFISILKLDFNSAVNYNVLSVPLFIGITVYCLLLLVDIIFDRKLIEKTEKLLSGRFMYIIYFFIDLIDGNLLISPHKCLKRHEKMA